jgi:hypothetical protein
LRAFPFTHTLAFFAVCVRRSVLKIKRACNGTSLSHTHPLGEYGCLIGSSGGGKSRLFTYTKVLVQYFEEGFPTASLSINATSKALIDKVAHGPVVVISDEGNQILKPLGNECRGTTIVSDLCTLWSGGSVRPARARAFVSYFLHARVFFVFPPHPYLCFVFPARV